MAIPTEIDLAEADLHELAAMANKFHAEVESSGRTMLEAAWNAGQTLLAAKVLCEHGEWLPWLEANFRGSEWTARRYMTLASNRACVTDLDAGTSIRAALEAIREAKDESESSGNGSPKGSGKRSRTPKMACDKFTVRYNGLQDDLEYMIKQSEKDVEFAAVAYNNIPELEKQIAREREFIEILKARFEKKAPSN